MLYILKECIYTYFLKKRRIACVAAKNILLKKVSEVAGSCRCADVKTLAFQSVIAEDLLLTDSFCLPGY